MISVIIVSWNTKDLLRDCLRSLFVELERTAIPAEVIVVDNHSADGSAEMVQVEFPQVTLFANRDNKGFGRANNQAFAVAKGELLLLLNPDTKVLPGALSELASFIQKHPQAGIIAPQLRNADGTIQRSCRAFPTLAGMFYELSGLSRLFPNVQRFREYKMLDFDHASTRPVDQPEGACLLIRREALDQIGMFDEQFFMLFEEVDLCYRAKQAGWEIWFDADAQIVHHYGQSIKQVKARMIVSSHKGMYRYWAKHHTRWYHGMIKPALWLGLWGLAAIRITLFTFKKLI